MYVIGKDIKKLRSQAGLTQEGFADALGVSVSTIRIWERVPDGTVLGLMREKLLLWLEASPISPIPTKFKYTLKKRKAKMETLMSRAKDLLGREVDVMTLSNGKFMVEYLNFNSKIPPPAGDTKEEAIERFLEYYEALKKEENTDADNAEL